MKKGCFLKKLSAIAWASENEIANGWGDGTFRPWNDCNRAAVVSFLYRY